MHKKLTDMNPVDDFVTRNTPGLKIWDENWGGMQCAYHVFAPGTDFTDILKGKGLEHDLCGVEHWAYVLKGSVEVIYLDGTVEICRAGEACFWPAPHNFKSKEGAEIPPVQHRWRVGCARQESPGVCRETYEEVIVDAPGPPQSWITAVAILRLHGGAGCTRTGRPRHRLRDGACPSPQPCSGARRRRGGRPVRARPGSQAG